MIFVSTYSSFSGPLSTSAPSYPPSSNHVLYSLGFGYLCSLSVPRIWQVRSCYFAKRSLHLFSPLILMLLSDLCLVAPTFQVRAWNLPLLSTLAELVCYADAHIILLYFLSGSGHNLTICTSLYLYS